MIYNIYEDSEGLWHIEDVKSGLYYKYILFNFDAVIELFTESVKLRAYCDDSPAENAVLRFSGIETLEDLREKHPECFI